MIRLDQFKTSLTDEQKERIRIAVLDKFFPDFKVEFIDEKTTYSSEAHTNVNTFLYFISEENPWKEYKIHCFQFLNMVSESLDNDLD